MNAQKPREELLERLAALEQDVRAVAGFALLGVAAVRVAVVDLSQLDSEPSRRV